FRRVLFRSARHSRSPVRNGAASDADLECLAVRERVTGHVAAVAPTPQADARTIDVRLALEPCEAVFQIAQLQFAEIFVKRPGGVDSFAAGCAVVANPYDVALFGQHLMPQVTRAAPGVAHL